jgi:hypothetical protein
MENKSKGLGDDIAKLTKVTGIDAVVKKVTKVVSEVVDKDLDCGCGKRQEKLNEIFPYK